jgi:hypothetical protein
MKMANILKENYLDKHVRLWYTFNRKFGSGYEKANSEKLGGAKPCVRNIGIGRLSNDHNLHHNPREGLPGIFFDFPKKCQASDEMCLAPAGKNDYVNKILLLEGNEVRVCQGRREFIWKTRYTMSPAKVMAARVFLRKMRILKHS